MVGEVVSKLSTSTVNARGQMEDGKGKKKMENGRGKMEDGKRKR